MLNLIEHLTSKRYVIGIWSYDIAPFNIQMFYSVNKLLLIFCFINLLFIF